MFTQNNPPNRLFIEQLGEKLQKHCFEAVLSSDSNPSVLLRIKEFQAYLESQGVTYVNTVMLSSSTSLTPEAHKVNSLIKQKLKLDVLMTVKSILLDEDVNTVLVEDATERGGLSGVLGKKYGTSVSKKGQNQYLNDFKLDSCHVSCQVQSVVEIIYSTLNQMAPGQDSK
jgi:hypothetical protein